MKAHIQAAIDAAAARKAEKALRKLQPKPPKPPKEPKKRGRKPGGGTKPGGRINGPDGYAVRGPEQKALAKVNVKLAKQITKPIRPPAGWNAREQAELCGFNPLAIMITALRTGRTPDMPIPVSRAKDGSVIPAHIEPGFVLDKQDWLLAMRDLFQYMVPKLSAVQVTGKDGGPVANTVLDVTQLMANPQLAEAAQLLALGMARQRPQTGKSPEHQTYDVSDTETVEE